MTDFKIGYKQLYKKYNKKLQTLHKNNFEGLVNNMDYFITYLKFMRDYYILTEPLIVNDGDENLKIATLATAVAEYENYQNCIHNYYMFTGEIAKPKVEGTSEEIQAKYTAEKAFHWNSFWNLVRLNMEEWMPRA
jgi:hypothetical protein